MCYYVIVGIAVFFYAQKENSSTTIPSTHPPPLQWQTTNKGFQFILENALFFRFLQKQQQQQKRNIDSKKERENHIK